MPLALTVLIVLGALTLLVFVIPLPLRTPRGLLAPEINYMIEGARHPDPPWISEDDLVGVSRITPLQWLQLEWGYRYLPGHHRRWDRRTGFLVFEGELRRVSPSRSALPTPPREERVGVPGVIGHYTLWRPDGTVYAQVEFDGYRGTRRVEGPWEWGVANQSAPSAPGHRAAE